MIKLAQDTYYRKRIKKSKPVVRKYKSGDFKISVHHTDNCFPNLDEVSYTLPYLRNHFPTDTCVVCLEKFKDGEFVRQLPCAHVFHHTCLDGWIQNKTNCPSCRRVLIIKFTSSYQCVNWEAGRNRKNIEIHMLTRPKFN
ncbi:hypothetical protein HELRODRAFT_67821 [Helobdella robusta]|uniref:RING-type domain-containing protein n=1 Tax=Helobdella robusta TaxID=6412 RepID=T1FZ58_HELRO|nr:hypothetical protein HELRODRAFT_67821 [Helobdella robusta]ESN96149.1 hypothetical protein HELRODRAFT_67821 [Helobdella robusta]